MSAIHEYKCDCCKRRERAEYNREHYLMPKGWGEVHNRDVYVIGHLCVDCLKKVKLDAGVKREFHNL